MRATHRAPEATRQRMSRTATSLGTSSRRPYPNAVDLNPPEIDAPRDRGVWRLDPCPITPGRPRRLEAAENSGRTPQPRCSPREPPPRHHLLTEAVRANSRRAPGEPLGVRDPERDHQR